MSKKATEKQVDIVTMYLINNLLYSVVDEMSSAVVRTSFSSLARDAFDFQCALFKEDGNLIMEGEGTILHSLAYTYMIRRLREKFSNDARPPAMSSLIMIRITMHRTCRYVHDGTHLPEK